MAAPSESAVILPVYNERATISGVLDAVSRIFDGRVVVVDDGSDDGTTRLLEKRDGIAVIRHSENLGYGRSLIEGFARALEEGVDAVVTMDCDGQHEPAHIPEFLKALDDCDICSGSRYLPESRKVGVAPVSRQDVNRTVTGIVNRATGWSLTDAFCGFKSYRSEALRKLSLSESGYAMPLELWAQAFRAGLCVVERPVERIYFDGDRSFGQDLDDPARRLGYYLRVWEQALG